MRTFHTVIIGGGPGGLACATKLARNGVEVLLLERNSRIGMKVCAGGLTWSGLHRRVPDHLIERTFRRQHITSNWQTTAISSSLPIISTVNREKLGQWMLQEATAAGATIQTGTPVQTIDENHVVTRARRYGYRNLVGADGSSSLVRRFLGIGTERVGTGIHYQVPGEFARMEWHLNAGFFNTGYGWIFPHRESASIGAYADRSHMQPRRLQENLHKWTAKYGINLDRCQPLAATINYDYRGWRFGNRYLVGDAAGLASGLTGEGILPAIVSGEMAADAILGRSPENGRFNRLLAKHENHARLLALAAKNRLLGKLIMETLILALRTGCIHFSALEMGA